MTSHTPQPPAGDDWRCPECNCHSFAYVDERKPDGSFGPSETKRCVNCKMTFAPEHTEPVAGEVVAWTTPLMLEVMHEPNTVCGTIWPKEIADPTSGQAMIALVTQSSYDALAAAKDAEIERLTREVEMAKEFIADEQKQLAALKDQSERLEAAERQRDEALKWAGDWHRQCQTVATILGLPQPDGETHAAAVRDKFDAVERQRDALREALENSARHEWGNTGKCEHCGVDINDVVTDFGCLRKPHSLKDEGSAT